MRRLLDLEISVQSFFTLSPFVEQLQFDSSPTIQRAVQLLLLDSPNFPLNPLFLNDAVNILAKFFRTSFDPIKAAIEAIG